MDKKGNCGQTGGKLWAIVDNCRQFSGNASRRAKGASRPSPLKPNPVTLLPSQTAEFGSLAGRFPLPANPPRVHRPPNASVLGNESRYVRCRSRVGLGLVRALTRLRRLTGALADVPWCIAPITRGLDVEEAPTRGDPFPKVADQRDRRAILDKSGPSFLALVRAACREYPNAFGLSVLTPET